MVGLIAIVDLGVGNFANVEKALGGKVTREPGEIRGADKIVLPGVGNFGSASESLKPIRNCLREKIEKGTPFLGICLGMQLLFPGSSEDEGRGLGLIPGKVTNLPKEAAPHIGWNQVFPVDDTPLLKGIRSGSYFYFVHSYRVCPDSAEVVTGTTEYVVRNEIREFPSSIRDKNVYGVQFHPEKSSDNGLRIMQNFKEL
ncbi:MAG: imidazole glycerol phosphate synthase subunit HisH [Candidatus Bipolaricaulota bacterium]